MRLYSSGRSVGMCYYQFSNRKSNNSIFAFFLVLQTVSFARSKYLLSNYGVVALVVVSNNIKKKKEGGGL